MQVVTATRLSSKVNFSEDKDWDLNPKSIYQCPNCSEQLSFTLKDLKRHQSSPYTNLVAKDIIEIEKAVASEIDSSSNLDFYCSGCRAPTRVYYSFWAGGRFTSGFEIEHVIVGLGA